MLTSFFLRRIMGGKEDRMNVKLMTVKQVSKQLGCALNTVYDLFKSGKMDGCLIGKKAIRFTQAQVDDYIKRKSTNNAGVEE